MEQSQKTEGSMESYSHQEARQDIDLFFSTPWNSARKKEAESALNRALYKHMTVGSTIEKHNVACQECWDYYQGMKREHVGG